MSISKKFWQTFIKEQRKYWGIYRDLGRIGDINAQVVFIDPEENGYTVDDLGYIVKYDVEEDKLDHLGGLIFGDDEYLYYADSKLDRNRRIQDDQVIVSSALSGRNNLKKAGIFASACSSLLIEKTGGVGKRRFPTQEEIAICHSKALIEESLF